MLVVVWAPSSHPVRILAGKHRQVLQQTAEIDPNRLKKDFILTL